MQRPTWLVYLEWAAVMAAGLWYFHEAAWTLVQSEWTTCEDAAQHMIWLYDLDWPQQTYTEVSRQIQPWGYAALLAVLNVFFEPRTITLWLLLPLLLLTIGLAFGMARRYGNFPLSLAFALLVIHFGYPTLAGGFARSFCLPILLGSWWLITDRRWGALAFFIPLSALFYPTAVLIVLGAMALLFLVSLLRPAASFFPHFRSRSFRWLFISGLVSLGLLFAKSWTLKQHPDIGPFHELAFIQKAPELGQKGRVQFAWEIKTTTPVMLRYAFGSKLKLPSERRSLQGIALLNLLLAFLLRKRPIFRAWRTGILLLFAAAVGHYLAKVLAPNLFIPDRFLSYPTEFFAAFVVWFPVAAILDWIQRVAQNSRQYKRNEKIASAITLSLASAILVGVFYWMPKNPRIINRSIDDFSSLRGVYQAVRKLPENVLIAAPPRMADQIPFLGQRAVYLSNELSHALYFQHYHRLIDQRWRAFIDAYFSKTGEEAVLIDFLEDNHITHLIVDTRDLGKGKLWAFEPYASLVKEKNNAVHDGVGTATLLNQILLNNLPEELGQRIDKHRLLLKREELVAYLKSR